MRVAILGAGAIAFGMPASWAEAGHHPVLWSPSGGRTAPLADAPLVAKGALDWTGPVSTAATAGDVDTGAGAVVIALPGNGHRAAPEAAAPHLVAGQVVIISSHASSGTLYLARLLAAHRLMLPIVVWGTMLLTGRQTGPAEVTVDTIRQKLDLTTLPEAAAEEGLALCTALFCDRFVPRDGLLAIARSNLNPQNHLGIAMFNLKRMEKGEAWGQGAHVTPAVGRLIEALDRERLAIARAFGLSVRTVQEHFALSFHLPMGTVSEMNQAMHRAGRRGSGQRRQPLHP